jgi:hypothetical protein
MHIDIRVAGPGPWDMTERERLILQKVPRSIDHVVMQDPEGNEFGLPCLAGGTPFGRSQEDAKIC